LRQNVVINSPNRSDNNSGENYFQKSVLFLFKERKVIEKMKNSTAFAKKYGGVSIGAEKSRCEK